nr:ammonium transporter 2 [Spirodela polyrhiza]
MANLGAYDPHPPGVPEWLNKGDNAWQMTAATLVGLQSVPGLVILYGSIVKKKWAVNSAFMALYAFAAVLIVWVLCGYRMAFGERLLPFWGKAGVALSENYLVGRAKMPASIHRYKNDTVETPTMEPFYPMATLVYFEFMYAAITVILLAGSLLGRMNIKAWMAFAPLWLIFSYTVGAFSLWGGGFLYHWGVIDYSGGYVIHLSSGIAGITAAYWVGPRLKTDRERFSPNNILLMLTGAGLLWMGWSGFNGGAPYAANIVSSMAVLNTNICAATSLLVWTCLDVAFFKKPSVIGAVQGMMTGLVCITPGAGLVHGWAAIVMGMLSGSIPWFTMMILHKNLPLLQKVDDTLAVFHTHAVAGLLGGVLTGFFAQPELCNVVLPVSGTRGVLYGGGAFQLLKQLVAACFVIGWNIIVTTLILLAIRVFTPLRMPDEQLMIGDDAAHGEEAYALWGDGERYDTVRHSSTYPGDLPATGARGLTIQL